MFMIFSTLLVEVEFHMINGIDGKGFLKLANKLLDCGYRPFAKDVNLYCPDCMEYGLVHENFIKCMDINVDDFRK